MKQNLRLILLKKKCLLEGLDDIALSLEKSKQMNSYEKKLKEDKPWIFND
jgi:3-isopropylmalate/(R)-2-methylmalate dehydratase small subunit